MLNCWTQGSGYVMKRACLNDVGGILDGMSFTQFCILLAQKGWVNGWYFPFIHEEHMDDPRSEYSNFLTENDFQSNRPLSAVKDGVHSLEEWKLRVRFMAQSCQSASPNPQDYFGWRLMARKLKNRIKRSIGIREPWRM
jgi:hypothetical protein